MRFHTAAAALLLSTLSITSASVVPRDDCDVWDLRMWVNRFENNRCTPKGIDEQKHDDGIKIREGDCKKLGGREFGSFAVSWHQEHSTCDTLGQHGNCQLEFYKDDGCGKRKDKGDGSEPAAVLYDVNTDKRLANPCKPEHGASGAGSMYIHCVD